MDEASALRYRAAEARLWAECGASPLERWVDVAGHATHVRVLEVGKGPPVLFVHGITSAASSWAPLVARLARRRCLVLDRPGCGLSQPLAADAARPMSELVDVQLAVLDVLDVPVVDLVGSSLGGAAVLSLAASVPRRVRRIVLEGAPAIGGIRLIRPHRLLAAGPVGRWLAGRRMSEADVRWYLGQTGHPGSLSDGHLPRAFLEWALSVSNDTDTQRNDVRVFQTLADARGFKRDRLFDPARLGEVQHPTLWLWGSRDPLATVRQGREWASLMPDAAFELVDSGHVPWFEDPGLHARRIDRFLGEGAYAPPEAEPAAVVAGPPGGYRHREEVLR